MGWGNLPMFKQYTLMFGLGQINVNGAGRYALTIIIVLAVRFLFGRSACAILHDPDGPAVSLPPDPDPVADGPHGLAVASVLFVVMRGSDWRFLFVGPVAVAVVYISNGFQWRSHGSMDRLMS